MTDQQINTRNTLALKHRPRDFDNVVGQQGVVGQLKHIVSALKIPNAMLFAGPTGTGKTTLARMVVRYVNCATQNSCGTCDSCKQIEADAHPDFKVVNAGSDGGVDNIRALIQQASFRPRGKLRVIMIDECHKLSKPAAEALLVPVEEPPQATLWILATTDPDKMPPALAGRCQQFILTTPTVDEIAARILTVSKLEGKRWVRRAHARKIAEASGGHVRNAMQILEGVLNYVDSLDGKPDRTELTRIVDSQAVSVTVSDLDKLASNLLKALYIGDPVGLHKALLETEEYLPLINKCLFINHYVLGQTTIGYHKRLWGTPINKATVKLLESKKAMPSLELAADIHAVLTRVRSTMQDFAVGAEHLLLSELMPLTYTDDEEED